jgi:hypothetical protein
VLGHANRITESTPKYRVHQGSKMLGGRVSTNIRSDAGKHLILPIPTQRICVECKKKTTRICR